MEPVIQLKSINKEFKILNRREGLRGSFQDLFSRDYQIIHAVKDVSMDIGKGEIVGYLGPNGAGKSTTIKMMTGVLEPTSGEIRVNGKIPYQNRTANAQNIGVVFGQRTQLWWALPVVESFKILKDIYRIKDQDYQDMLKLYESIIDMRPLQSKPVRQLSLGQRTLSDILAAFLHNPPVVFLDEPTIGLDVSMKSKIRDLIKMLNKEKQTTVILTTHDMGDVDALCKRIAIIDKGAMLYDNHIDNLKKFFGVFVTLKIQFSQESTDLSDENMKKTAEALGDYLMKYFPKENAVSVSVDDVWLSVLIDEGQVDRMTVLNAIQQYRRVIDVTMQEISTESIIKKIYEGGIS